LAHQALPLVCKEENHMRNKEQKMKNQKFFFSVAAVLFVLGVFALFFFGFKSRFFAQVGTVNLVPEQVAVVDRPVVRDAVVNDVLNGLSDNADVVAVNTVNLVGTALQVGEVIQVQRNVHSVNASVEDVSNVGRQVIVA
jgi:hypothetical protein